MIEWKNYCSWHVLAYGFRSFNSSHSHPQKRLYAKGRRFTLLHASCSHLAIRSNSSKCRQDFGKDGSLFTASSKAFRKKQGLIKKIKKKTDKDFCFHTGGDSDRCRLLPTGDLPDSAVHFHLYHEDKWISTKAEKERKGTHQPKQMQRESSVRRQSDNSRCAVNPWNVARPNSKAPEMAFCSQCSFFFL